MRLITNIYSLEKHVLLAWAYFSILVLNYAISIHAALFFSSSIFIRRAEYNFRQFSTAPAQIVRYCSELDPPLANYVL